MQSKASGGHQRVTSANVEIVANRTRKGNFIKGSTVPKRHGPKDAAAIHHGVPASSARWAVMTDVKFAKSGRNP